MFRSEMKDKLSQIFGMKKTTYSSPSPDANGSFEQETLFIEVLTSGARVTEGKQYATVQGNLIVFAQYDKLPFGYFQKKIQQADHDLTKDFIFREIDVVPASSPARIQNIAERRIVFTYLYSAQYDPEHGELTSLEI